MFACTNTCFCAQTPANLSKNRSNVVQNRSKSLKITRKLFETARNCLKWLKDRSQPPPPPPPPLPTVSTVYEQCTNTSIPVSTPSVLTPPLVSQHLPLFQDLCLNVNPAALVPRNAIYRAIDICTAQYVVVTIAMSRLLQLVLPGSGRSLAARHGACEHVCFGLVT